MNGVLDSQTSDNHWVPLGRPMLHERTQSVLSPTFEENAQQLAIEDFERQMSEHDADFAKVLDGLRHWFIFTDQSVVESFLRSNRSLAPILIEAAPYFQESFDQAPMALDVMTEEGPARTIYALALWRGERSKAKSALNKFDEKWWLKNLRTSAGRIVFDYELLK